MDYLTILISIFAIAVPVVVTIIIWGSKINSKLAVICVNHSNLVETIRSHNLKSDISEAKLETLEVKVALLEKDIQILKEKVNNAL